MTATNSEDERTILDYLDPDCWRHVLGYLPLQDIMRTETVSKQWQTTVLTYLRGVRISIQGPPFRQWTSFVPSIIKPKCCNFDGSINHNKVCVLRTTASSSFESWTHKLGPSVVSAYCDTEESLTALENCPNLKALTLFKLKEDTILKNQRYNLKWLQKLSFRECYFLSDRIISRFISNNALEELELRKIVIITGKCLINKNMIHLKSLVIEFCYKMQLQYLLHAADYLGQLTRLEMSGGHPDVFNNIHLLLEKMPKLEDIHIHYATPSATFFKAVSCLSSLRTLNAYFDATDDDLKILVKNCQKLKTLKLMRGRAITGRGLAAVCALAGARFTELGVWHSEYLTDDDIEACIRACPNLKALDVSGCHSLTQALLPRAAAARHAVNPCRPLLLHQRHGVLSRHTDGKYPYRDLIICIRSSGLWLHHD